MEDRQVQRFRGSEVQREPTGSEGTNRFRGFRGNQQVQRDRQGTNRFRGIDREPTGDRGKQRVIE